MDHLLPRLGCDLAEKITTIRWRHRGRLGHDSYDRYHTL